MGEADIRVAASSRAPTVVDQAEAIGNSLEWLYDQYGEALFRYALALTGSAEDAEDAVQEVFAWIARHPKPLVGVENARSYVYAATHHAACTIVRRRSRREELDREVGPGLRASYLKDTSSPSIESIAICEAFSSLPADQREVLVLKVYDQMTFQEIAKVVGVPQGTVVSRYNYAVRRLRQALEEE